MKTIGLTGGIGSGKTTVAKMFMELGVPVYIADTEAKALTNRSKVIRKQLIKLLGEQAYNERGLDRKYVANIVFKDSEILEKVNKIIHPKVAKHFARWVKKQKGVYCIKEAAILFENGSYIHCDATILVTAPKAVRMKRILKRDQTTEREVSERMQHQWSDEEKEKLADFVIENTSLEKTKERVLQLHKKLSKTPETL